MEHTSTRPLSELDKDPIQCLAITSEERKRRNIILAVPCLSTELPPEPTWNMFTLTKLEMIDTNADRVL